MPARQDNSYSISIPMSPPPPQDLSSYQRLMAEHTKRQMESAGGANNSRSNGQRRKGSATSTSPSY